MDDRSMQQVIIGRATADRVSSAGRDCNVAAPSTRVLSVLAKAESLHRLGGRRRRRQGQGL